MTELEKVREAYISKSGKSLLLKVDDDPSHVFTFYLCIHRETLARVMADKKAWADVMLVKE